MSSKKLFLCLAVFLCSLTLSAQDKSPAKFGNVTAKDFGVNIYSIDSNANAVVLADIGYSSIEGNNKSFFSLVFKHFKRIHILNKNGFDAADVSLSLYSSGDAEEQLDKVKAVTYNLENGKVTETKLDVKSAIFKDKISREWVVKKFTFPNVKEGSIIEYEYTLRSDFLHNLQPWAFQGAYPVLWSEYNLTLPEFMGYAFLTKGYRKYDINERKSRSETFFIAENRGTGATERGQLNANVTDYRWVIKNVPPLKEESFTSALRNHLTRIEFQLSEFRQPLTYRNFTESWGKVMTRLLESESFGEKLLRDNGWLGDITHPLVEGVKDPLEKTRRIYNYVRDNFTCTSHSDVWLDQTLRNIVKTKSGTVAEINVLLAAMLKREDIEADPVILSTRSHGVTYELYPLLSQYNYVVVQALVDGKPVYLDASEPRLGFGHLPTRCYNGHARVVNKTAQPLYFLSDTLMEKKVTTVFLINDDKGNIVGSFNQVPGYFESFGLRETVKEKGVDQLISTIKKGFIQEVKVDKFGLDSLDKKEELIGLHYDFDLLDEKEDILYFNPMLTEAMKENPFKSSERMYPVEMPFGFDETYNMQMEVPAGYTVEELPKSMVVKMNEAGEGVFEYRISQSGSGISFRSRIQITRANFQPDEYEMLREFFNLVVKKQAEQIVFKKKS